MEQKYLKNKNWNTKNTKKSRILISETKQKMKHKKWSKKQLFSLEINFLNYSTFNFQ